MKNPGMKFLSAGLAIWAASSAFGDVAFAKVSPQEAEKLKTTLTPLGGEKAGNPTGSIPAWTGGLDQPEPVKQIDVFADPFAAEKPLFTITAQNAAQYADQLSEGAKALLAKFPDSFRMDVYPAHRTAAVRPSIYDGTFKNATQATLVNHIPVGSWGGIPYPIPADAEEIMWNHNLRWNVPESRWRAKGWLVTSSGQPVLTSDVKLSFSFPSVNEELRPGQNDKIWEKIRFEYMGPPIRAGEGFLSHFGYNPEDDASWTYLTGQRRVRKVPTACCDTPHPATAGVLGFDEVYVFNGRTNRFDWTLVGKKEMYIPYNSYKGINLASDTDFFGPQHINPDAERWELHRVWVVEANLAQGYRHTAPKARFYIDEDTWTAMLGDRWDTNGQLWKFSFNHIIQIPQIPAYQTINFGYVDLIAGTQCFAGMYNDAKQAKVVWVGKHPDDYFEPQALAGDGVR